ncbi:hypothetical protein WDI34_001324 [Salmonella enterica subsp. enterica]|uniref:hypothetical protein n=1 Tax=Salmonella enterica TaxID=28901 RepID=UPI000B5FE061|nr:hypothetical protein [Salmonella enterica]ASD86223.1 hypothetical protein LFZ16_08230 [Salmonella enterica subsp. enterica serovar India str. SA20085604]ECC9937508.1 hypothetical protein [Salmonella enterica subsp. enterica]EFP1520243.1 hypothetical protein [Salmonella enterica]EJI0208944.1 hypothetical protein [Salmonella enterica subsp. enterica]
MPDYFNSGRFARSGSRAGYSIADRAARLTGGDNSRSENSSKRHSEAHYIASSQAAQNNPLQALQLLRQGTDSRTALKQLSTQARMLSCFTARYMESTFPGWECLDDEDKNAAAFLASLSDGDSNGYMAAFHYALNKIRTYLDPLTTEEILNIYQEYNARLRADAATRRRVVNVCR